MSRSVRSAEWRIHIACNCDFRIHDTPGDIIPADGCDFGQSCAAKPVYLSPVSVHKPEPERFKHARTAVICGTAADAYCDAPTAVSDGVEHHLAGAICRRQQGIALFCLEERKTACRRHLHQGFPVFRHEIAGLNAPAERIMDGDDLPGPSVARCHRLGRSLAAVADDHPCCFAFREYSADSFCRRFRHFL